MKYKLTAEFEMDEATEDSGELLEQIRLDVADAVESTAGGEEPRVRIEEVS